MTCSLDVEQFISEVQKYPEIWDINCEENRLKSRKQAAWNEIANVFVQDFEDMSESEKDEVYKKLYGKWRNIRDSFVRHIKRKDNRKGYTYAKNLAFLNSLYTKSPSDDEYSEDDKKSLVFKPRIEMGGWSEDENSIDSKRKRVTEETEFVEAPILTDASSSFQINEDEDRSFFDSLLPAVRNFDLDQKLEFRCEVLGLVKKFRSEKKKTKRNPD